MPPSDSTTSQVDTLGHMLELRPCQGDTLQQKQQQQQQQRETNGTAGTSNCIKACRKRFSVDLTPLNISWHRIYAATTAATNQVPTAQQSLKCRQAHSLQTHPWHAPTSASRPRARQSSCSNRAAAATWCCHCTVQGCPCEPVSHQIKVNLLRPAALSLALWLCAVGCLRS
jgi:hypothetical protein